MRYYHLGGQRELGFCAHKETSESVRRAEEGWKQGTQTMVGSNPWEEGSLLPLVLTYSTTDSRERVLVLYLNLGCMGTVLHLLFLSVI